MTGFLHGLVRATAQAFDLPGPILEVGSLQVPGQEGLAELRPLFPGQRYTGLDNRRGRGVDVVGDVEALPYPDGSVGTVLALSTFEHVPHFWRAFDEVHRVLRPDGALLVSCPFYFHLHGHPCDYWRFSPDALTLLLDRYPSKIIGWHGPASRPANVWAIAFREGRPPITPAQHARYRNLLREHACMPLPWLRRLRLRLGALLFGHGHFAPYLLREQWQMRCLNQRGPARKKLAPARPAQTGCPSEEVLT
jgi:SAM-dependent methyltransferase